MITIIIPVYNQQEFLPDAIESALNQTVKAKVIVVNDGSTDNSLDIARKYKVKVIDQINKGLSAARNTGLMNTTSKYVIFLDADDILQPDCIESMAYQFQVDPDIICWDFKSFGIENNEVKLVTPTFEGMK